MEEEEPTVQLGATYSCKRKDGSYRDGEVVKLRVNKRAGREVLGVTRRQAEWVDKTRLVLCKPVKEEEDVENGAEQKISEDENTIQNTRPEEDEPETKKVKVDTSGTVCKDEERTCLLCSEFCEDPVVVECGHSFCRNCINNALASQDSFLCPDCEKVTTEKKSATKLPLAAISKTAVDATATLVQPLEKVKAQPLGICPEHDENLKLFCKDDCVLACIICRNALKHSGHKFLPVADVVGLYRAELPTLVSPLEEALKEASELSNQQSEIIEQLQNTITECRQHVISEFGNLYSFLKERREKLLEQLKEQSQCILEDMKTNTKMEEQRDSLKEIIAVAKQKVDETDGVSFLDGIKDFVKKCRVQRQAFISFRKTMTEKKLCRATFKSPIQYFTWKQMKSVVPVPENEQLPVTPNTEQVPESSTNLLMLKDSVPENEQLPVTPNTEQVPESSTNLLMLKDSETPAGSQQIWIVGDGFMNSIKSQAEASPLGLNLGLPKEICSIHWWMECETWLGLFPKLRTSAVSLGTPDVLLFHLGSEDLHMVELQTVINRAQDCFNEILSLFKNVKIILSTLLPKPNCRESRDELRRKGFNYSLIFRAKKPPYHLFRNEELEKKLTHRYATGDLSPLTEAETKGFLQGIKDVLQQTVLKECKPSVAGCERLPPGKVPSEKVQNKGPVKGPNQPYTSNKGDSAVTRKDQPAIVRVKAPVASASPAGKDQPAIVRVEAPVASAKAAGPKEIWITGSSYTYKASLQAKESSFGINLGLDKRQWVVRSLRIIRRFSLLDELSNASRTLGIPSIVYLHVGSNDLRVVPYKTLIDYFKTDFSQLVKFYPETQFIFSSILPRPEWMWDGTEENRLKFNFAIRSYAKLCGFSVASSRKLDLILLDRFYANQGLGSLTFAENEMFLSIIKRSIQEAMLKVTWPVTEKQVRLLHFKEPQKKVLSTGDTLIVVVPGTDPAASDKEVVEEKTSECLQPATEVETPEGSVAPPVDAPLPSDSESKQIWIVGNSDICRAAQQAKGSSYGFNLGFKPRNWTVHWMGRVAMQWKFLLSELNNSRSTLGVPNIIFIHLGDNDVGNMPSDTLTNTIEDNLDQIMKQFPTTELIFSTMLPKAEWLTNNLEQQRQDINSALVRYAEELGFHVTIYEGIEESAIYRFKNGGSNVISEAEYDLFVKSIKDALEMIVLKLAKAQTV